MVKNDVEIIGDKIEGIINSPSKNFVELKILRNKLRYYEKYIDEMLK